MQLILKPTSHADLEEVVVSRNLFAVGRQEEPFNRYPKSVVAKLSKRHARLFAQDGRVYLADLGSLNGTECNGEPVKSAPRPISHGDTISFGGLAYEVDIVSLPEPTDNDNTINVRLVLTPENLKHELEPIVISSFPFLVNKHSPVFDRYKDTLPEQLAYISRRHAHIFILGEELCVEDLGSTNGTYVDGAALDEHVKVLKDGNLIAFGSEQFLYRVHLLHSESEEATEIPAELTNPPDHARTIFVDSPTSFIDVYFVDSEEESFDRESDGESQPAASSNPRKASTFRQIRSDLFGDRMFSGNITRTLMVLVVLAAGAGGYYYWQGIHLRELTTAFDNGEFEKALAVANDILQTEPDNTRVQNLATDSLVGFVVPAWAPNYQANRFEAARAILEDAANRSIHNPTDDNLLALLSWSTDVHEFLANRPSDEIRDPFIEAAEIQNKLTFWLANVRQHTRELGHVNQIDPDFASLHSDIFADIRTLRNLDLESKAVRDLGAKLTTRFAEGDIDGAKHAVNEFLEANPNRDETPALREDLGMLVHLERAIAAQDWLAARDLVGDASFQTAPFNQYAQGLEAEALPDTATMNHYHTALQLWRDGQLDESNAALTALTQSRWGNMAEARLLRQRELRGKLKLLKESEQTAGHEKRLFEFYAQLDQRDDQAVIEQLRPDFLRHSKAALEQAEAALRVAQARWGEYRREGGIQTEHRLESRISDRFRTLAGLLSASAESLSRCSQIYDQLERPRSSEWQSLQKKVKQEASLQRSALRNLEVVPAAVREQKLKMLPRL